MSCKFLNATPHGTLKGHWLLWGNTVQYNSWKFCQVLKKYSILNFNLILIQFGSFCTLCKIPMLRFSKCYSSPSCFILVQPNLLKNKVLLAQ